MWTKNQPDPIVFNKPVEGGDPNSYSVEIQTVLPNSDTRNLTFKTNLGNPQTIQFPSTAFIRELFEQIGPQL